MRTEASAELNEHNILEPDDRGLFIPSKTPVQQVDSSAFGGPRRLNREPFRTYPGRKERRGDVVALCPPPSPRGIKENHFHSPAVDASASMEPSSWMNQVT